MALFDKLNGGPMGQPMMPQAPQGGPPGGMPGAMPGAPPGGMPGGMQPQQMLMMIAMKLKQQNPNAPDEMILQKASEILTQLTQGQQGGPPPGGGMPPGGMPPGGGGM